MYYSIWTSFFFFSLNSFINIGNRLSRLLHRVSLSNKNHQMTKDDFQSIGLNQRYDRLFINEYIRIHHIPHVTISNPDSILFPLSPCCPCPHSNWCFYFSLRTKKRIIFYLNLILFIGKRWLIYVRIWFFFDQIMKNFP